MTEESEKLVPVRRPAVLNSLTVSMPSLGRQSFLRLLGDGLRLAGERLYGLLGVTLLTVPMEEPGGVRHARRSVREVPDVVRPTVYAWPCTPPT